MVYDYGTSQIQNMLLYILDKQLMKNICKSTVDNYVYQQIIKAYI